ncbi:hypothetical protein KKD70_02145 [Patescibacteria group bacterium]|nr:hypothetical protein [Patescibacteria group bacterium]
MPALRLQDKFLNLPMHQKIIGGGALISIIGAILPWYSDIDQFNTGDTFLGVTGPLYLVGYIIIALSLFSVILTAMHAFEKKLPPLPMKESIVYIISGAASLFLMVIANSVYTHYKFGINLTSKEQQFGMMIAFVGALAVTLGGVLQNRESGTSRMIKEFQEEAGEIDDQILELNNFQKEQQSNVDRSHVGMLDLKEKQQAGVREYKSKSSYSQPSQNQSQQNQPLQSPAPKKMSFDAYKEKYHGPNSVRKEPYPDISQAQRGYEGISKRNEISSSSDLDADAARDKVNPNSVIRMDL